MTKLQISLIGARIPSAGKWPQGWWLLDHAASTPVLPEWHEPMFCPHFVHPGEHGAPKATMTRGWLKLTVGGQQAREPPSELGVKVPVKYVAVWLLFWILTQNVLLIWLPGKITVWAIVMAESSQLTQSANIFTHHTINQSLLLSFSKLVDV